jgi:putative transposase
VPPDADWREREALFRYRLICEAADPALTPRERGLLVRALAARPHPALQGVTRRVARSTLDEWIRALRRGGFDALKPAERLVHPRTPLALLEEAQALRREASERTGALIGEILRRRYGELAPSKRTITRHLRRHGLTRARLLGPERAFGRFEAARPNEMWTADVLHGPQVAGRRALLFGILDDHSRFVVAARVAYLETTVAFQQVLRPAFMSRGLPERLYVDNGAPFASEALERTLAVLGVRLTHSRPGRPQGRGKVERLFRTIPLVGVRHRQGSRGSRGWPTGRPLRGSLVGELRCRVGGRRRGRAVNYPTGPVSSRRLIEPCMRFSLTRLTDALHRRHSADPATTVAAVGQRRSRRGQPRSAGPASGT